MIRSSERASTSFPRAQRLLLVVAGGALATLLATAVALTPDARGYGTHEELGLPACWMVECLGVRCPSCGMTTAWAHLARGELLAALGANVGGVVLAAAALLTAPWMLVSGLQGRWLGRPPSGPIVAAATAVVTSATLLQWCLRILAAW